MEHQKTNKQTKEQTLIFFMPPEKTGAVSKADTG